IRDHQRYIDAFLDAVLPTGRITFVIHDWSSALGLDWASRHHERVAGLALMEWITALSSWASRDLVFQDHFRTFRTQDVGRALIIEQNFFVDTILTMGVVRGLTEEEMIHYRRPFLKPKDREPIWRLPNEIPIEGHPEDVWENAHRYTPWLLAWNLPKLFFWVTLERSSRKRTFAVPASSIKDLGQSPHEPSFSLWQELLKPSFIPSEDKEEHPPSPYAPPQPNSPPNNVFSPAQPAGDLDVMDLA
ncbi:uncharacterized protein TRIREDRAFT_105912, partial [Trichoderma reesei QM6a]